MPYIGRDENGRIVQVHDRPNDNARERVEPGDPDLTAFLTGGDADRRIESEFLLADLAFVRVLEDLIAALIDKRVIMLTDLPKAAQEKIARRYELRSRLSDLGGIVSDGDEVMLP